MSAVDTILTNTILIPSSDSLVSGKPLKDTTIGRDLLKYNTNFEKQPEPVESAQFRVYIISGGQSVPAGLCETINGLAVSRAVEAKRAGGNGDYTVKLPGVISYPPVTLEHLYSDSDIFMDWLVNGSDSGGVQKADIEIHVGEGTEMVYTLRDAFPISWKMGTMSLNLKGLVTQESTLVYSISANQILVENVTFVYGRLDYSKEKK